MKRLGLFTAMTAVSLLTQGADLVPSDSQIAASLATGRSLAATPTGYPLEGHIAWQVPDSRNIDPSLGDVDAIVIATPLERATHAGFEATHKKGDLTVEQLRQSKEWRAGWLEIIVFTHGPDGRDESYIDRFSGATFVFADRTLTATSIKHSDPSESIYPLAAENRQRQVATISFRFDLSASPELYDAHGRLQFTDDRGKFFDVPINLGDYR